MPEVIQVTCKADLNRAVANALHPEPTESQAAEVRWKKWPWRWVPLTEIYEDCSACDGTGNFYRHDEDGDFLPCDDCKGDGDTTYERPAHWQPIGFCTDPVASKLLRDRMRERGWWWTCEDRRRFNDVFVTLMNPTDPVYGTAHHPELFIAMCLAALRALNVEFELLEGWDEK